MATPSDPFVTAARMRIVRLLVGNPPQAVPDLMQQLGVTRTAVMEQVGELVAGGLVERETQRGAGRGRPKHLYRATDTGLRLFASHWLVVPAIWRGVERVGGKKMFAKVLKSVADELADYFSVSIRAKDPVERLRRLGQLLQESGELVDVVEENGQVVLRKRSCTFLSLHEDNRDVSCIGAEMMSKVVNRPVCRTACRHEGSPCCTFQILEDEQASE